MSVSGYSGCSFRTVKRIKWSKNQKRKSLICINSLMCNNERNVLKFNIICRYAVDVDILFVLVEGNEMMFFLLHHYYIVIEFNILYTILYVCITYNLVHKMMCVVDIILRN